MAETWIKKVYADRWIPAVRLTVGELFAFHPSDAELYVISTKVRFEYRTSVSGSWKIGYIVPDCPEFGEGALHPTTLVRPISAIIKAGENK